MTSDTQNKLERILELVRIRDEALEELGSILEGQEYISRVTKIEIPSGYTKPLKNRIFLDGKFTHECCKSKRKKHKKGCEQGGVQEGESGKEGKKETHLPALDIFSLRSNCCDDKVVSKQERGETAHFECLGCGDMCNVHRDGADAPEDGAPLGD